ncbi:hypothetical protein QY97_02947 [Bacillus thermotolerans]|nr:hypothetical protein QY97_02947 [Bacillus thermotolerans]
MFGYFKNSRLSLTTSFIIQDPSLDVLSSVLWKQAMMKERLLVPTKNHEKMDLFMI